jgi:hypothetical protein
MTHFCLDTKCHPCLPWPNPRGTALPLELRCQLTTCLTPPTAATNNTEPIQDPGGAVVSFSRLTKARFNLDFISKNTETLE